MALTVFHRLYLAYNIYRFANSLKKHMRSTSVSHQFRDEETNWLSEQLMSLSNDNICRLLSSSVLSKKKKKCIARLQITDIWLSLHYQWIFVLSHHWFCRVKWIVWQPISSQCLAFDFDPQVLCLVRKAKVLIESMRDSGQFLKCRCQE